MKKIIFTIAFLFMYTAQGQNHQGINRQDSIKIEKTIKAEIDILKNKLLKENRLEHHITFTLDTFRIERKKKLQLEKDYSTTGMINAGSFAIESYDQLMNKYYKLLFNCLDNEDQFILKQAQRDWLRYRNSEEKFNGTFTEYKNTGGGTIFGPLTLARDLEITRQRVREIYSYFHLILVTLS